MRDAAEAIDHRWTPAEAHHVAAAHRNLSLLGGDAQLAGLFSPGQVRRLHACLDALDRLIAEAGRLAPTLLHGDLHVRSLGLADDGHLALIDRYRSGGRLMATRSYR